jgi:hypothetical protein
VPNISVLEEITLVETPESVFIKEIPEDVLIVNKKTHGRTTITRTTLRMVTMSYYKEHADHRSNSYY